MTEDMIEDMTGDMTGDMTRDMTGGINNHSKHLKDKETGDTTDGRNNITAAMTGKGVSKS